ncbi:MAG: hypothetical protein ACI945_001322 [Pseudohongiellaceae bacterium]|jgi:hypothetical protein
MGIHQPRVGPIYLIGLIGLSLKYLNDLAFKQAISQGKYSLKRRRLCLEQIDTFYLAFYGVLSG